MTTKGYLVSGTAIKRIAAVTRREEGRLAPLPGVSRREWSNPWYFCKLATACAPGSFSSPTTCTVNVWQEDQGSVASTKPLIVTTDPDLLGLTVKNFWKLGSTAAVGTQAAIQWSPAGWVFTWLDCE